MGQKLGKIILCGIFALIFIIGNGKSVSALDIKQKDLSVSAHSSTLTIHNNGIGANDFQITPQLEFNKLGDLITYKLTLHNNDGKRYKIANVTDDNINDAIELTYAYPTDLDTADKSLELTIKYVKKSTTPLQTVTATISLVDEDDISQQITIVVPNTGTNIVADTHSATVRNAIIIYGIMAAAIIAIYIIIRRKYQRSKKSTKLPKILVAVTLALGFIPVAVIAASSKDLQFIIEFNNITFSGPYTITFNTTTQDTITPQTINHNDYASKPQDPTKPGYTFSKWLDETNTEFDFTATKVTKDYNLTATYTLDTYQLNLDLAGGTAGTPVNPITYTYETNDITLTNPTKDHYDFTGWTTPTDNTPKLSVTIPKNSTGDKTFTANFTPHKYTITYDLDGGSETTNPTEYTIKTPDFTLAEPTPPSTDKVFAGWLDISDPGNPSTTPVKTITITKGTTGNKSFKATYKNFYTVTFDVGASNDTPPQDRIILDGDKIDALPNGPKPIEFVIYGFDGWYVGDTKIDENHEITDDTTVVAKYVKKQIDNGIEDLVGEDPEITTDEACHNGDANKIGLVVSDDPDSNARYIGKCPSNYVMFNNELWRIIGVFNVKSSENATTTESRVKIIRDTPLKTVWGGNMLTAFDIRYEQSDAYYQNGGDRFVSQWGNTKLSNGTAVNGAHLQQKLNTDFLNGVSNPETTNGKPNSRWYHTRWNRVQTDNFERYDATQSLDDTARSLIGDTVWNTGAANYYDSGYKIVASTMYNQERSNAVPNTNKAGLVRTTIWTGRVGLLYPSDYLYSPAGSTEQTRAKCIVGDSSQQSCEIYTWLAPTSYKEYTMTPVRCPSGVACSNIDLQAVWVYAGDGATRGVQNTTTNANNGGQYYTFRPVVYLKSDVKILSGTGEKTNPFKIGLIPDNVTTHFDTGGGTQIPSQTTSYEGKATRPTTDPEKEGYTFKKWVDENGDDYDFNKPVTADQTITAVYEAKPYTVTFKPGDEATINDSDKTRVVLYDDPIGDLPTPAVSHPLKEFSHWEVNGQPIDKDYIVKGDTEAEAVLKGKKTTNVIDDLVDEDTTDATNTTCYASDTAGRSLVLSDDPDNNPRYVGKCPKNYVYFNCKTDPTGVDNYDYAGSCEKWRIIGVFDVDDGTGKIEKRVKIMRADPLTDNTGKTTYFAYDTTQFSIKITNSYTANFVGFTQWGPTTYKNGDTYPGALLMRELNGDYLNYNLTSDPAWPTFTYAHYDKNYDRRQSLSAYAQTLIGDAVWHTGAVKGRHGFSDRYYDTNGFLPGTIPKTVYEMERGDLVPDFGTSKENSDNHDPLNRTTKWTGKVGLIYYSDIPYATNGYLNQSYQRKYCLNNSWDIEINVSTACSAYDWLVKGSSSNKILTMTPAYYTRRASPPWSDEIFFGADGLHDATQTYGGSGPIHPVVFLNADVRTSTGTGALNDPFTLE